MFLIRTIFWLSIVIMIMPTDSDQKWQLLNAVRAAAVDLGGFCHRNQQVCTETKLVFAEFSRKAQQGAEILVNSVQEQTPGSSNAFASQSTNTLRADDLKPTWELPNI